MLNEEKLRREETRDCSEGDWYEQWLDDNDQPHSLNDNPAIIEYTNNNIIIRKLWCKHGKIHRLGGPACVEYYDSGKIGNEKWYNNGYNYNPADLNSSVNTAYYESGEIMFKTFAFDIQEYNGKVWTKNKINNYYRTGELMSESLLNNVGKLDFYHLYINKPTHIDYYKSGNVKRKEWHFDGLHSIPIDINNTKLPSIIEYHENGNKKYEGWYDAESRLGYHRLNGPAKIWYYEDGSIFAEKWYYKDLVSRLEEPAYIEYESGKVTYEAWYKDDEFLSEKGTIFEKDL